MSLPGYHNDGRTCQDCPEYAAMLAGNLELHMKVSRLISAILNHQLNCQVSTAVDSKLWDVLEEIDTVPEK